MPESKSGALTSLATPQLISGRSIFTLSSISIRPVIQRMALKPLRHESAHSPRHLGLSGARVGFCLEFGEHARSGARHARLRALRPQPRKLRCHLGVAGDDERLEIVRSLPREKGRYFESFRRACQRAFECFLRGNRDLRRQYEVPGARQPERGQALADAFAKGVAAIDENRHIRAELQREFHQFFPWEKELPEAIQNQKHGGGIRAAAAAPAAFPRIPGTRPASRSARAWPACRRANIRRAPARPRRGARAPSPRARSAER